MPVSGFSVSHSAGPLAAAVLSQRRLDTPESIFVRCNSVLILSLMGASAAQHVLRAAASV